MARCTEPEGCPPGADFVVGQNLFPTTNPTEVMTGAAIVISAYREPADDCSPGARAIEKIEVDINGRKALQILCTSDGWESVILRWSLHQVVHEIRVEGPLADRPERLELPKRILRLISSQIEIVEGG